MSPMEAVADFALIVSQDRKNANSASLCASWRQPGRSRKEIGRQWLGADPWPSSRQRWTALLRVPDGRVGSPLPSNKFRSDNQNGSGAGLSVCSNTARFRTLTVSPRLDNSIASVIEAEAVCVYPSCCQPGPEVQLVNSTKTNGTRAREWVCHLCATTACIMPRIVKTIRTSFKIAPKL